MTNIWYPTLKYTEDIHQWHTILLSVMWIYGHIVILASTNKSLSHLKTLEALYILKFELFLNTRLNDDFNSRKLRIIMFWLSFGECNLICLMFCSIAIFHSIYSYLIIVFCRYADVDKSVERMWCICSSNSST